jgi:uncharacterized membrane protein
VSAATACRDGGGRSRGELSRVAFTIGMSHAVSNVTASGPLTRRVVPGHALLSFVDNTAIRAPAVSLLFGRLD